MQFSRLKQSLLLLLLIAATSNQARATFHNTIFWMHGVPQSNHVNPALIPQPNFYIGLPLLSSWSFGVANRGFKPGDMIRYDASDQLYWDEDRMLGTLRQRNLFHTALQFDWLSAGFRSKDNYFFIHATERVEGMLAYSDNLAFLAIKGIDAFREEDRSGRLDELGLDFTHYRSFSLGFARQWSEFISTGIRGKLLFGLANTSVAHARFETVTRQTDGEWLLASNILLNNTNTNIVNILEGNDETYDPFQSVEDAVAYILNTNNTGVAVDVGLTLKPAPAITLSLGMLNLGFINWKTNTDNLSVTGTSEFNEFNLQDLLDGGFFEDFDENTDTISFDFDRETTHRPYRQSLPSRVLASAAFDLSERHQVSFLSQGLFYNNVLYPSFGIAYYARPSHAFGISLSYSVAHMNYYNIGLGMNLNMGPLQFYVISDNLLAPILPFHSQLANIQFGLNLVFGYRPKSGRPLQGWQ